MLKTRHDRDSLNLQLLSTIKHKVALSQEVDAWQVRIMFASRTCKAREISVTLSLNPVYMCIINSYIGLVIM